jgi:hypothetical protein
MGKPNTNFKDIICCVCKKKGHFQDKSYTRIPKGLPCVDANGVPLKSQSLTPPSRTGRVAKIGQQGSAGGHHGGVPLILEYSPVQPMANFMMPPQGEGGYWTHFPNPKFSNEGLDESKIKGNLTILTPVMQNNFNACLEGLFD